MTTYSIDGTNESGSEIALATAASGEDAATKARAMAAARPDLRVYVSWFRASDGQRGYLNPSMDHDITGKPWCVDDED